MLLLSSATVSKKAGVVIQEAGLQEANSGIKRYPSELSNVETLEIFDVLDESDSETEEISFPQTGVFIVVSILCPDTFDVDISEEELSRTKSTPFYDLILYVFKKTLTSCDIAARVLLSGIINTLSPGAGSFTLSPKIKSQSLVPSLSQKLPAIEVLLSELLLALCPDLNEDPHAEATLVDLQAKIWELLGRSAKVNEKNKDQKAVRTVLVIMDHICTLLTTEQLVPPVSEHVFVSAWSHILNVLFQGSNVRAIPGELVPSASKSCRSMVEEEFGSMIKYNPGRKVDMSIRVYVNLTWENEICIFEFKSTRVSDATCQQQQRKSVRLNGAILLDLEKRGLDIARSYPIIAEARGLVMDFYTLRRYDDVLGARRSMPSTSSGVWLPSHQAQLKQFLKSDSLHVLLAFAEQIRRFALDVIDVFASSAVPSFPTTPPMKPRILEPYILFTPSKSNKRPREEDLEHA
ncbi:hypothetical protein BGZ51_000187 [Haplosporangium sp. Z 767]|nr:hypothetical protein BGZ51_000187 [Haplosporangium sp. Z 767]